MRSFKLTLILCGLMLLVTPTKAHAWWELLDYLSGPGPFVGPRVDVRWCPPKSEKDLDPQAKLSDLDGQLRAVAKLLTGFDNRPLDSDLRSSFLPLLNPLIAISTGLKTMKTNFPIITDQQVKAVADKVTDLDNLTKAANPPSDARSQGILLVVQAIAAADLAFDALKNGLISIGATGVLVSLCNPDKVRTVALDGGVSVMHSFSDDTWANGHTIWMYELSAGITIRPYSTRNVDHDYFDFGAMAGGYFFSSAGMQKTVKTFVIQPFVDVHAPTTLVNATGPKYWLSQFTLRVGFPIFGSAIPASDFNGVDQKDIEKVEAKRLTFTVYYNVWPKLRKRTHAL